MKKILLIGITALLLTGCGSNVGKGADLTCSGDYEEPGIKGKSAYYFYYTNNKLSKVDYKAVLENDEDAERSCSQFKSIKKVIDIHQNDMKVTCDGTTVIVENVYLEEGLPLKEATKEETIKIFEEDGSFTCK